MFGQSGHGLSAARSPGGVGQQLELGHRRGALPMRGAEAVGAGVAAADDDHVLALRPRSHRPPATSSPSQRRFCCVRYSIAKWTPRSSRPGTSRSRGLPGAAGQQDGVEVAPQIVRP